ncbi:MAG: dienelactone hydrolase family protein [Acidobacteria bacterium]|nr:dienelactone hydrolase family protein [Acidobacteriota bacterium]
MSKSNRKSWIEPMVRNLHIPSGSVFLEGELVVPAAAAGIVLFAHGSGSSRFSPRNQYVARILRDAGIGTLLFDLLTRDEEVVDLRTGELRFDINLLAERLADATSWIKSQLQSDHLRIGYFGASTGAAAALVAAAKLGGAIAAIVSRGGRPDLAAEALSHVESPTLLIVGGRDEVVIQLNQDAYVKLACEKELKIIPGATHLFEEPGALEEAARLAADWFRKHLAAPNGRRMPAVE